MKSKLKLMKIIIALLSVLLVGLTVFTVYTQALGPGTYTIEFETNGATSLSDLTIQENTAIPHLEQPKRLGFRFDGWYTDPNFNVPFNRFSQIKNDMTLYANWIEENYMIVFDSRGGTSISPITRKYNQSVSAPNEPTREGYVFDQWYTDLNFDNRFTFDTMPAENVTLYAKWIAEDSRIDFDSRGGTPVDSLVLPIGTSISDQVTPPTREGYTFTGWFTDEEAISDPYYLGVMPNQEMTLYAGWDPLEYTLSYETNHDQNMEAETIYHDDVLMPTDPPDYENHDFVDWYLDPDFTEPVSDDEIITGNLTLYARWELTSYEIKLYHDDGTEFDSLGIKHGSSIGELDEPVRPGYTFDGWFADAETTLEYDFDQIIEADDEIYAKWVIAEATLSFEPNGGTPIFDLTEPFGSSINEPIPPTKTGHRFAGWFTDEELTEPFVFDTMPEEDTTLYANWTPNDYTITYETFGGTAIDSVTASFGSNISRPNQDPSRPGYVFRGWYSSPDDQDEKFSFDTMPAEDITIYANWRALRYYIELYDRGTLIQDAGFKTDEDIELTVPTREGYTLVGWLENGEPFTLETMPPRNLVLHAVWEANPYDLIFEVNGGLPIDPVTYGYEEMTEEPEDPVYYGHNFLGWFSDPELTEPHVFDTMPMHDVTVYAKWEASPNQISFDTDGGTMIDPVAIWHGHPIILPENPQKAGYTFIGWFEDESLETAFTEDIMPPESFTIYAKWEANEYTIVFETYGGSSLKNISGTTDSEIEKPVDPYRYGHRFEGWYLEEALTTPFQFDTMPPNDVTLHAKWEIETYVIVFYDRDAQNVYEAMIGSYDSPIALPQDPEEKGYIFAGWYLDQSFTIPFDHDRMPGENTFVYSKWDFDQFTITFDAGEGFFLEIPNLDDQWIYTVTADYLSPLEYPIPTQRDHTFTGWFYYEDDQEVEFTFDTMPAEDYTLYAKWEPDAS